MNDELGKVFDVSKPNQVNPGNTSRPIIPGHHPQVPDPMMRPGGRPQQPSTPPASPAQPAPSPGIVLQTTHAITDPAHDDGPSSPLPGHHETKVISVSDKVRSEIAASDPQLPLEPQPETPQPITSTPSSHQSTPGIVSASPPRVDTPATTFVSSATSPGGNVVAPTTTPMPATSLPAPGSQPVVPEVHHQTLPMGHAPATSAGRLKHFAIWLFVILFLLAFAGYLAIDSGFVNSPVKLPFHIFDRQS